MPYNFVTDSIHTKKLCSGLSSKRNVILHKKWTFCVFEPPLEGLGATYDVHLRVIGKLEVDFLLVITELFSIGVTTEALQANISIENRPLRSDRFSSTQNFRQKGSPQKPFFLSEN